MTEEQVKEIVTKFTWAFFEQRIVWQAGQMLPGLDGHILAQCHDLTPDNLLTRMMEPQEWLTMARYGAGLTEADPAEIYEICQGLAEWLFALPDYASYEIPTTWYETPMGNLWLRAFVRVQGDALITLSEAAQLAGVSVAAISERVAKGKLRAYPDPNEPNPQRRQRVKRGDIV